MLPSAVVSDVAGLAAVVTSTVAAVGCTSPRPTSAAVSSAVCCRSSGTPPVAAVAVVAVVVAVAVSVVAVAVQVCIYLLLLVMHLDVPQFFQQPAESKMGVINENTLVT